MENKFVERLLKQLNKVETTAGNIIDCVESGDMGDYERVISIDLLLTMITDIEENVQTEAKELTPKTKFLYVEDGSVDLDALEDELFITNPEIKVIAYRQGSQPPILIKKED